MSIIFARPRHEYGSYADFWTLVKLSEFPIVYMDEIDDASDNVYIFSTPATHWWDGTERNGFPNSRARIVSVNIEWYLDVDYRGIPGVEVWCADKWYADLKGLRYVPLGSHPALGLNGESPLPMAERAYDVVTLWAPSHNRYAGEHQLALAGAKRAPDGWGSDRHEALRQSRLMVNVHQWADKPAAPPQRFALAAAYHLPVLTEPLGNPGLLNGSVTIPCEVEYMATTIKHMMKPENVASLQDKGDALYQLLCVDMTFRKSIEAAL